MLTIDDLLKALEPIKKDLQTIKTDVHTLQKGQEEILELTTDIFHTVGEFHDKLEKRVRKIEDHLGLPHLE